MHVGPLEDAPRLVKAVAGVEHELDRQPVPVPLLDFVEVTAVAVVRIVGLLVGLIGHGSVGNASSKSAGAE